MKLLSELLNILSESKMSDRHQELQDAIMDEFNLEDTDPMVDEITKYLTSNHNSDKLDDFLQNHFDDITNRGGDFDPSGPIANKMEELFGKLY